MVEWQRFWSGYKKAGLVVLAILSGGLVGAGCNQADWWGLVALGLVALSWAVVGAGVFGRADDGWRRGDIWVTVAGLASWHLAGGWWVFLTVRAGTMQLWWGAVVVALVVAGQVVCFLVAWLPLRWLAGRLGGWCGGAAGVGLVWVVGLAAADTLRQLGWLGNGYSSLAVGLIDAPGVAGLLPLIGGQGLGFLVLVLATGLAWCGWSGLGERLGMVGLIGLAATGLWWLPAIGSWTMADGAQLKVVVLQTQFDKRAAWSFNYRDRSLDLLQKAIAAGTKETIVLTPETFFQDSPPADEQGRWGELLQWIRTAQVHVVLGIVQQVRDEDGMHLMNAALHLTPERQSLYGKERLVPGGEYLLWPKVFGVVYRQIFDNVTEGQLAAPKGLRQAFFAANTVLGMSICHELAFALTMAERAKDAGILINLADDSWIPSRAYRQQMLGTARLRSMELGKPLIRVTNGGRSVLVNPRGEVEAAAGELKEIALMIMLRAYIGQTPYQIVAPWVAGLPWIVWSMMALFLGLLGRSNRRNSMREIRR